MNAEIEIAVTAGVMKSVGRVVGKGKSQIIAEAVVRDGRGREAGHGNGVFVHSRMPLTEAPGYGGGL